MNITYPCLSFPVFRIHIVAWGKALFFRFPVFLRMHIVAVGAKGALAGWTGSSVALPKVAADDIPVLPEGVFRPLPLSHAPKDAGASGKPLPIPAGMALLRSHLQVRNPCAHAPAGAKLKPLWAYYADSKGMRNPFIEMQFQHFTIFCRYINPAGSSAPSAHKS